MKIKVNIQDKAIQELIELLEDPTPVLMSAGIAAKRELQRHYRAKNEEEPNKLGGKRTNFWANVGRSIKGPIDKGGKVQVQITDKRIRQKIYGGTIVPKASEYLTIPLKPEAHGVTAEDFETETGAELFYVELKGNKFLAANYEDRFQLFYLLKQEITQDPWPNSLPKLSLLQNAAKEGAIEGLKTALAAA